MAPTICKGDSSLSAFLKSRPGEGEGILTLIGFYVVLRAQFEGISLA
jgi:hypothetical protein